MTREEAKFILTAYRATASDRDEAVFAEALEFARKDPELASWFAREQMHDAGVASRLREVGAPDGLRDAILAGVRASGPAPARTSPYATWGLVAAAAAAAAIAVVVVREPVAEPPAGVPPVRSQLQGLESFVINDTLMAGGPHQGRWGDLSKELHKFLSRPETKLGQPFGIDYDALCDSGARKLMFEDREIIEVCFRRELTDLWYHLYVLKRADFPVLAAPGKALEKGDQEGVAFAYWHDDKFHFVVTGAGDHRMLKHLF